MTIPSMSLDAPRNPKRPIDSTDISSTVPPPPKKSRQDSLVKSIISGLSDPDFINKAL